MAVNSTSGAGSSSIAQIDVAAIVDQLMKIENKPLDQINKKIEKQTTVISDLGVIKSKMSAFADSLSAFENANSYNTTKAFSNNADIISAVSSNGAKPGSYSVTVKQLAVSSTHVIETLSKEDSVAGFALTFNGKSYTATTSDVSTVSELKDWINSLGINVSASLIARDLNEDSWTLMIQSAEAGELNAVTITNNGGLTFQTTPAENSEFEINGLPFVRSTNSITDVIDGVTLELYQTNDPSPLVNIRIQNDNTDFSKVIESLVASYNDLIATHKSMTANSLTTSTPGTFASDPSTLSFINEVKARFSKGIYYGTDYANQYSLSSLGINMQLDGSLKFDKATFSTAVNNGLQDILRKGVSIGYQNDNAGASSTLNGYLNNYLKPGGYFRDLLTSQTQTSWTLLDQQENIQSRLDSIRQRYITQYSALNALLYQLSSTSNALGSALDALNNQNQN